MKVTELTEGYTFVSILKSGGLPVRSEHTEIAIILPQVVGRKCKTMKSVTL